MDALHTKRSKNLDVVGTSHDPEIGCTQVIQSELEAVSHISKA
jgi:hypothetical protein